MLVLHVNGKKRRIGRLGDSCLLAGQLGAGLQVGGELGVVACQGVGGIADAGDGIGAGLRDLLGQLNGGLHLLVQAEDLGEGLDGTAVCDRLLLGVLGAGTDGGLQIDDVAGGVDDLQVGIDQIGHITGGIDAALDDISIVLQSTVLDAHDPLDDAVEALNAAQCRLDAPPHGREEAKELRIECHFTIHSSKVAGLELHVDLGHTAQRLPGAGIYLQARNLVNPLFYN